ncbi:unnamed protein product [Rotaria magnacalcarata]|uniref:ARID domain-containing protein n=1 Tax=Rotaria magnacalcarata TaxID=392030 RepID=A0A8S2LRY2_9BILA|nr:unnamed protein product [Rotaria magnacalcarata]
MNDPTNNMSTSGHPYMDSQYPNIPQPNYGYPPQQMNPYGNHPPQMHGQPTNDFRPPPIQSMDDDSNVYRNKPPLAMMIDQQQQQSHHPTLPTSLSSQAQSISSSTNGPKSPSGTSMSSYVPDDADSSNSSFPDSPPPSHEKGQQKRKLSSATSNAHSTPAEVFTKLRDMGDESERQERYLFVERLQKLWEENQIVCRNLPSISKQTIDLYRLYTCVREQNGFQEFSKVAKNRHWRDIASKLNIPNSSSAAFNVKQKYINLKLFHYECKYDRGGISPEPILGEIEKQQGKRTKTPKKGANNSGTAANNTTDNTNDGKTASPQVHSQSQPPVLSQQQPQQPPVQDPYRGYPPPSAQSHPHQMGHPQQQYRPMQMPMHPYGTPGNEMQPSYDPSSSGPMMYSNPEMDYQRVGYPPGQQPPQMMKPPSNVYGMPPPPQSQVAQPPSSMAPQHRPPGPYPSIASKPQQQMVPSSQQDYNAPSASSVMCAPPNQHAPPTQVSQPPPPLQQQQPPTSATGPQQTYHYQPQQPMPSAYPPLGYQQPRPPMMSGPPQTHDPYLSQQVPPNQTYPNQVPPTYMYKKSENSTTDSSNLDNQDANKGNKILMNQLRSSFSNTSMLPTSTPISILTSSTTSTNATITPSSMPTTSFPPNSIEATTLSSKVKRKKLTAKDVTPVDPWKLMMSLRGGLLAETTWALDTINIMLTDDQTHTYFRLKQMPGLLQAIVDIYLKCLTQLFDEFKSSPSNIEDQQPLLKDLNGSSHLTCTTIKKHENKQQESTIYRVESNSLNKYRRKYNKEQSVVYDRVYDEQGNEKTDPTDTDEQKCSPSFCWAECVINVRENTLVTLANIAGTLVLDTFDSDLLYTLIDGLLHWSTCYSGEAIDSLQSSLLSAQRLAIEILTKLSVHEMNMDFILATPPFYRIVSLFHVLTDWLIVDDINGGISNWHPPSLTSSTHYYTNVSRPQSHIQREFAIVLLNALVRCDSLASSVIAHIPYAISLLLNFLEDYEMKTNELMVRYGPDYVIRLTTQPSNIQHAEQILFTTGDMLKRAATCLLSIVSYSDNIKLVKRYEDRILNLSTSHVIDSNVGRVLTDVLHYCSLHNS